MRNPIILLAVGEELLHPKLRGRLLRQEFELIECFDRDGLLRAFRDRSPDLVILGSSGEGDGQGLEAAQQIRRWDRQVPLILLGTDRSEAELLAALRAGVNDYLRLPLSPEELLAGIQRCLSECLSPVLSAGARPAPLGWVPGPAMIGQSPPMQRIRAYLERVARTSSTVLITGETGTGKELAAELIHQNSPRRSGPFVAINCAAIPGELLESELFGHEKGAFTGALASQEGRLREAQGGTVLLDEVGDMSLSLQAKILRVLESRQIQRLGGKGSLPLDVRLIAATNQDLERLVWEQRFRKDLYFRLDVAVTGPGHLQAHRLRPRTLGLCRRFCLHFLLSLLLGLRFFARLHLPCYTPETFFGKPRIEGSHHIFKTSWPGDPRINLQAEKGMAKAYQIKQVVRALKKLQQIEEEEQDEQDE